MFDAIIEMYRGKSLGANETCSSCNKDSKRQGFGEISKPLSICHVGSNFHADKYKILFVGKNARGTSSDFCNAWPYVIDARKGEYSAKNLFFNYNKTFWSYTKEIACRLLDCKPEDAFESIAITNLIKCNNAVHNEGTNFDGTYSDYTTKKMKDNCMGEMKVFWEEVNILKPKHIILYTHYNYDDYLETFPDYYSPHYVGNKTEKSCGVKCIRWWDREFYRNGDLPMRVLITSHPERKKKEEFISMITRWIQKATSE
ncbi:MAG: hypothetical protein A2X59_00095 [Nitrospirae bacterium GWC2_42_7]|nr:MAG: hypothetical protein A2X59_00095 [Nitrospirae bacterium GWC2_42_7]